MSSQYEIINLIGQELYARLAYRKGGTRIYIPVHPAPDGEITEIIGFGAAKVLSAHLGNSLVHISRGVLLRARNEQISDMRARGLSAEQIGRIFKLKARTVRLVTQHMNS
jgi:DNA-binding NarL/FixJ family response regulator